MDWSSGIGGSRKKDNEVISMLDGAFEPEGARERRVGRREEVFNRFRPHICRGLLYARCLV